jgi:hypothetical protein
MDKATVSTRFVHRTALGWGAHAMFLFRLLGLLLITLALMALGADALKSIEAGALEIRSLSALWSLVHQASYDGFTGWVSSTVPAVSGPLTTVMSYPAWAVLGVIGIVIAGLIRLVRR